MAGFTARSSALIGAGLVVYTLTPTTTVTLDNEGSGLMPRFTVAYSPLIMRLREIDALLNLVCASCRKSRPCGRTCITRRSRVRCFFRPHRRASRRLTFISGGSSMETEARNHYRRLDLGSSVEGRSMAALQEA